MKNIVNEIIKKFSKEEIENYYIDQNHTKKESAAYFNLKSGTFTRLLEYYNIRKPMSKKSELIKNTNLKKYGVEFVSQNKEVANKIKNSWSIKTEEDKNDIVNKIKNTSLERYGVTTYSQLQESKDKVKQTNIKKFGVDSVFKTPDFFSRAKKATLEKYGDETYRNPEKTKNTLMKKYGVDNFSDLKKLPEMQEKMKKTMLEKYNVEFISQRSFSNCSKDFEELFHNRDKSIEFFKSNPNMTFKDIEDRFNCSSNVVHNWIYKKDLTNYIKFAKSNGEEEIFDFLKSLIGENEIIRNDRKTLTNLELDFYIPSKKIAVEFNGNFWHSSLKKDKNYHYDKSLKCERLGIRLIHIWEYEWADDNTRNKLKNLIKVALKGGFVNRLYARKCIIKEIDNKEAKIFNNENHLQGHRNAQVTYGLFYNNKLIQLMSFSKSKYNRNLKDDNSWEIIRSCSISNTLVVGGVNKLISYFIKKYNPKSIFSYCDFNKFTGTSYLAANMKFIGYTGPDMKWWLQKNTVINRLPRKHKELKENAVAQLWGAGSKKYILERDI